MTSGGVEMDDPPKISVAYNQTGPQYRTSARVLLNGSARRPAATMCSDAIVGDSLRLNEPVFTGRRRRMSAVTTPAEYNAVCSLQPSYPYDILPTSLQETSR